MTRKVVFDKDRVSRWTAERVKRGAPWVTGYQAFGIEKDGELIAGCVIDSIVLGGRCSMHGAGDGRNWLTREFTFIVFDYIFRQLGCNVVVNTVDADNYASLKFTAHLGYKEFARLPGGSRDCDTVLFMMLKDDCRWLKTRN